MKAQLGGTEGISPALALRYGMEITAMAQDTLSIGSYASGTTRTEDRTEAVLDMARSVGIEYESGLVILGDGAFDALSSWLEHYNDHADEPCEGITSGVHFRKCPLEADYADELIDECIDALSAYVPIYCYIGALDGDGADFGVWLDRDALQEAIRQSVPLRDVNRFVNADDGVIVEVNDHGNVTVWQIEAGRELLAIV